MLCRTLGTETVNPINDGGLRICHKIGKEQTDFRLRGVRPVLSLEAKRRKSKRRDDPNLPWDYAGQIFAEMLGQVCYEDFYNDPAMDYQEAFVIHGSHSSITIYYCKFPNQYLSEISRFGKNFLTKRTFKEKVKLLRTRKFSFRDTNDRVELFGLLAKLLWYLVSGESRVGYLYNYPDIPLHTIGKVIHDSIAVEDSPKLLPAVKLGAEGDDSMSLERVADEEGNDSNESFSASEAGGDVVVTGGLDSAGEEEEEDETEGEPMDLC